MKIVQNHICTFKTTEKLLKFKTCLSFTSEEEYFMKMNTNPSYLIAAWSVLVHFVSLQFIAVFMGHGNLFTTTGFLQIRFSYFCLRKQSSRVFLGGKSATRLQGSKACFYHLLHESSWTKYLTTLCLSFLICNLTKLRLVHRVLRDFVRLI